MSVLRDSPWDLWEEDGFCLPIPKPNAMATQESWCEQAKAMTMQPTGAMTNPGIKDTSRCSGKTRP